MRQSPSHDARSRLLPEGRRWGFGAHSVLPYLTMLLESRAADGEAAASIRNPVFPQMEKTLKALRKQH